MSEEKEISDKKFIQNEINHLREQIKKYQDVIDGMRKSMKRLINIKKRLNDD